MVPGAGGAGRRSRRRARSGSAIGGRAGSRRRA